LTTLLVTIDAYTYYSIEGAKKLDKLCTMLAITQDLKYILNTDSCDYYQFEKFNKQEILEIIEDLDETCWDCQYLLESAHSYVDGNMPECGHPDVPDKSGLPDLNNPPGWCPISEQVKEFRK